MKTLKIYLLAESTLGDAWKDVYHVVRAILLILIIKRKNVETITHEISVEEPIHYEHLEDDVGKADNFTEPVSEGIHVVLLQKIK